MGRIDPREERKQAFLKRHAKSKEMDEPFRGLLRAGVKASMWRCEKGTHEIDIIPYQAGRFDPAMKEGEWTYVLEVFVHNNVGPDGEQSIICLAKTYGKPCPICEHRKKLLESGGDDELAEQLKVSRYPRSLYNIVCYDKKGDDDKIQIFNTSHFLFEMHLLKLSSNSSRQIAEGAPPIVAFADPDEGKTIIFTKEGEGRNTRFTGHKLDNRPKGFKIPDSLLKRAIVLDEAVFIPTYKEVYQFFWGVEMPEDGNDEDTPKRSPSRSNDDQPVPTTRSRRSNDDDDDEEDDEPKKGKRPQRDTADDSYLNKDEEDEPKPKKGKCPNGGTFGKSYGDLEECEDCDEKLWKECYKASEPKDPEDEIEEDDDPKPKKERAISKRGKDPEDEIEEDEEEDPEDEIEEDEEDDEPPVRGRGRKKDDIEEDEENDDSEDDEDEEEGEDEEDDENEQPARTRGKKEPLKRGRPKKAVKKLGKRR
jgi:hypothetical protein